jgi:hypothetical protein
MNSSVSALSRLFAIAIGMSLLVDLPIVRAQTPPAPAPAKLIGDEPLVIANGKFTRDGKGMPATVKNLMELIRLRYPDANITVVGVDDIGIENLTLHWARYRDAAPAGEVARRVNPPLKAVLTTLSAASGHKFVADMFSEKDVLLEAPEGLRQKSGVITEVFNLSPLLTPDASRVAELTAKLRDMQSQLAVLKTRYAEKHPAVVDLNERIELATRERKGLTRSSQEVVDAASKVIEDIQQTVLSTLRLQELDETQPQFRFHTGGNLLVVVGSEAALDITRKVVAALELSH